MGFASGGWGRIPIAWIWSSNNISFTHSAKNVVGLWECICSRIQLQYLGIHLIHELQYIYISPVLYNRRITN